MLYFLSTNKTSFMNILEKKNEKKMVFDQYYKIYKAKFSITNIIKKKVAKRRKCFSVYTLVLFMLMLKFELLIRFFSLYFYKTWIRYWQFFTSKKYRISINNKKKQTCKNIISSLVNKR